MYRRYYCRLVPAMFLAALCGTVVPRLLYGQGDLNQRLTAIDYEANKGVGLDKLEAEALKLIEEFQSPKDVGKVYAHIAHLCYSHGQRDKVIAYTARALQNPLDLRDSARAYLEWGSALGSKYFTSDQKTLVDHRREIAVKYLSGLKLLLDKDVQDKPVPVPGVGKFDCDHVDDPICQEMRRKHEQQVDARKRAEALSELVQLRITLTQSVMGLYIVDREATEELKQISSQILKNDAVVAALVANVKTGRERGEVPK